VTPGEIDAEVERQLDAMAEGAESFVGRDELRPRLASALGEGRPLRVKLGMDPSAPDLHLGHTLVLRKLRRFQELGHRPLFLVGDFTARIGDPSGRKRTRPALDGATVRANAETYVAQVSRFLDVSGAEVRFNGEWMEPMPSAEMLRLCASATVARLLERDDFHQRYVAGEAISLHELLYPMIQAYDSVALRADVELGGTDQTFNLLMAREVQRHYGQPPQAILTHPLLVGTDGRDKMSKSLGNYVGVTEPPEEIYGKVMSISDELMETWYRLLPLRAEGLLPAEPPREPLARKHLLARAVTRWLAGEEAAERGEAHFRRVVQRKELPEEIPEVRVSGDPSSGAVGLLTAMVRAGMASSNSEARRLVVQGGVRLDDEIVKDPRLRIPGGAYLLQVGKRRFARIRVS